MNSFAQAVNLHLLGLNSHSCYHSQGLFCCMRPFRFLVSAIHTFTIVNLKGFFLNEIICLFVHKFMKGQSVSFFIRVNLLHLFTTICAVVFTHKKITYISIYKVPGSFDCNRTLQAIAVSFVVHSLKFTASSLLIYK